MGIESNNMTRKELFKMAGKFFVIILVSLLFMLLIGVLLDRYRNVNRDIEVVVLGFGFMFSIFSLIGFFGGLYFFVLALFRKSDYIPEYPIGNFNIDEFVNEMEKSIFRSLENMESLSVKLTYEMIPPYQPVETRTFYERFLKNYPLFVVKFGVDAEITIDEKVYTINLYLGRSQELVEIYILDLLYQTAVDFLCEKNDFWQWSEGFFISEFNRGVVKRESESFNELVFKMIEEKNYLNDYSRIMISNDEKDTILSISTLPNITSVKAEKGVFITDFILVSEALNSSEFRESRLFVENDAL